MKTKILVAMIACLAIAACSKQEGGKEEHKGTESTQGTGGATKSEPAHPGTGNPAPAPAGHSSANEAATTIAADDTAANASNANNATQTAIQDADKKVGEMKQDMSTTANQLQGNTTSSDTANKAADHTHED